MVKLRYVTSQSMDAPINSTAVHTFRANSLYDPDYTILGHQPMGFDQWAAFYNKYVVVSCKITCTFTHNPTGTTGGGQALVGIQLAKRSTMGTTDTNFIIEDGNTVYKSMSNKLYTDTPTTVSKTYSTKNFFNVKNVTDNWTHLGATTISNPTDAAYLHVWCGNAESSIDPFSLTALCVVEYTAIFGEPNSLPAS